MIGMAIIKRRTISIATIILVSVIVIIHLIYSSYVSKNDSEKNFKIAYIHPHCINPNVNINITFISSLLNIFDELNDITRVYYWSKSLKRRLVIEQCQPSLHIPHLNISFSTICDLYKLPDDIRCRLVEPSLTLSQCHSSISEDETAFNNYPFFSFFSSQQSYKDRFLQQLSNPHSKKIYYCPSHHDESINYHLQLLSSSTSSLHQPAAAGSTTVKDNADNLVSSSFVPRWSSQMQTVLATLQRLQPHQLTMTSRQHFRPLHHHDRKQQLQQQQSTDNYGASATLLILHNMIISLSNQNNVSNDISSEIYPAMMIAAQQVDEHIKDNANDHRESISTEYFKSLEPRLAAYLLYDLAVSVPIFLGLPGGHNQLQPGSTTSDHDGEDHHGPSSDQPTSSSRSVLDSLITNIEIQRYLLGHRGYCTAYLTSSTTTVATDVSNNIALAATAMEAWCSSHFPYHDHHHNLLHTSSSFAWLAVYEDIYQAMHPADFHTNTNYSGIKYQLQQQQQHMYEIPTSFDQVDRQSEKSLLATWMNLLWIRYLSRPFFRLQVMIVMIACLGLVIAIVVWHVYSRKSS